MNILFISAILPYPLYSGGQVRMYNLLKRLSQKHSITLCSFIRHEDEKNLLENLKFCKEIHVVYRGRAMQPSYIAKSLFGPYPLVMSSYDLPEMKDLITRLQSKNSYDLIHIEPGYVWPSIPDVNLPIVVGEHNIEHRVYQEYVDHHKYPGLKQLMQRDVGKLKHWEKVIWEKAAYVVTVSDEDAFEVRSISSKVGVVPNGIDPEMFEFQPKKEIPDNFSALFIGNFRWIQNKDAVKYLLNKIWPTIIDSFPNAKLRIVGRDFPEKTVHTSVSIINHVEEITDEFKKADIVLAPIRVGGGTKYKILEAMASGIPVITTKKGTQGLPLVHRKNCYIAENGTEHVEVIKQIITQPDRNVIKNARKLVEKEYSWNIIAKELADIWERYAKH